MPPKLDDNRRLLYTVIALLIIPLSGLAVDIYVPSLPMVSQYFGVEKSLAQLSVTSFMIGLGIMQLFAGSISDSYGRRKPFLIAMILFVLSTLAVPLSHSIDQLIIARFVQGVAAALSVVPIRAVIMDLYEGREFRKMSSYTTMVWSIGPIIAPAIGSYLQHYFNWQASFYFLAIYGGITLILAYLFLPETSKHRHSFAIVPILERYQSIAVNKTFLLNLSMNGSLYAMIILFSVVGPFLLQDVMHFSVVDFGHIALLMGLAWFVGTMCNRFLIDISQHTLVKSCLLTMLAITLFMFVTTWIYGTHVYLLIIPNLILLVLGGAIFPTNFAKNMALFPKISGSANAFFGAAIFVIAGLASGVGALLEATSALPLIASYVVIVIICLICFHFSRDAKSE